MHRHSRRLVDCKDGIVLEENINIAAAFANAGRGGGILHQKTQEVALGKDVAHGLMLSVYRDAHFPGLQAGDGGSGKLQTVEQDLLDGQSRHVFINDKFQSKASFPPSFYQYSTNSQAFPHFFKILLTKK